MSRPVACFILFFSVCAPLGLSAQSSGAVGGTVGGRGEVFAGSDLENYLRYLQTLGMVPLYPWGARSFSPAELDRLFPTDTAHPWALRYDLALQPGATHSLTWLAPSASLRANTTFPYGFNDGPIWAGRGLTLAGQAGFAARAGVLSLTIAPEILLDQNAAFTLMPNGQTGRLAYADGPNYYSIDRPQRFGNAAYARLDPGQTTLRVDWRALAFGVTTANQYWGPASVFPIMLGNNAPGFPHAFLGTSRPVDLWLLRIHGRLVWGRLSQSAFSPATAAAGVRFATGIVLVLIPRGIPGLELGFTRFSHQPWPGGFALLDLLHMLHGRESAASGGNAATDNQLATAFFRWVLPHSGFEVYGEYGRDDYNQKLRDFFEEPDHIGGYTVGFRKVGRRAGNRLLAVRAEVQNLQFSRLAEARGWAPFYTHTPVSQGHTQLGQVLGSEAGVGGAGSEVAVESYSPRGRWTLSWTRMLRQQRGNFQQTGVPDPQGFDVEHALAAERLVFRGRYDLLARVTAVYEFNRDFQRDAFDLNLILGVRAGLR